MSARATPPFRADQVGSLLRPPEIRDARAKVERGELSAERLSEIEDRCIREAVARRNRWVFASLPTASTGAAGGTTTSSGE